MIASGTLLLVGIIRPEKFGRVAFICWLVRYICGALLIPFAIAMKVKEKDRFICHPDAQRTHEDDVVKACYTRYEQTYYNTPLPLFGFVVMNCVFPISIFAIYSALVGSHIEEIDKTLNETDEARRTNGENVAIHHGRKRTNRRSFYVLKLYSIHLFVRFISSVVFTVLQFTEFFPSGFDFEFTCNPPKHYNVTSIMCENPFAGEKKLHGIFVCVFNVLCAVGVLYEVIFCLWRRLPVSILDCRSENAWTCDAEFITDYLLRKEYTHVEFELCLAECRKLVSPVDIFIDVGILNDLINPNRDSSRTQCTLVLARAGMGKTTLINEFRSKWARKYEDTDTTFYHNKILFCFRIQLFNDLEDMTFKTLLRSGLDGLEDRIFESILEEIQNEPGKAILLFDGLDKFNGDFEHYFEKSAFLPNDRAAYNKKTHPIIFFIKLALGNLLRGATVLVTSRPIGVADSRRLQLFDRTIELRDFTYNEIQDYAHKFCETKFCVREVWDHINNSQHLQDVCSIPLMCFHVCQTLCEHSATGIPALTKAMKAVIHHIETSLKRDVVYRECFSRELQKLAYNGIEKGGLEFHQNLQEEMIKSGLLYIESSHTAFEPKFIHLTIQRFLAARHVAETFAPDHMKTFVSKNIANPKWDLVCKFINQLNPEDSDYDDGLFSVPECDGMEPLQKQPTWRQTSV